MDDYRRALLRVDTPKLLPTEELNGLIENFRYLDADQSGTVSCEELISSGLLDREQAIKFTGDEFGRRGPAASRDLNSSPVNFIVR